MINCYHPNCDVCKHETNCILKKPYPPGLSKIKKEINFELGNLKEIRKSITYSMECPNDYYVADLTRLLQEESDTVEIIRELRKKEKEYEI